MTRDRFLDLLVELPGALLAFVLAAAFVAGAVAAGLAEGWYVGLAVVAIPGVPIALMSLFP